MTEREKRYQDILRRLGEWREPMRRCSMCKQEFPATAEFFSTEKGIVKGRCKKCRAARSRMDYQREKKKEQVRKRSEKWRRKNPEKQRAYNILRYALKTGSLTKPTRCERCHEPKEQIQGHHHDYQKPLEVTWLCPRCHGATHRQNRS